MKRNLTRKSIIIRFFFGYWYNSGITGPIFSVREQFLEVLGKGVARGWAYEACLPSIKMFQIFGQNFS